MTIARAEVLRRANSVWPMGGVPYSQAAIHRPDGYRQDCSGYVSACWAIPLDAPGSWGGMNTVSLVTDGWMREIRPDDLKPGDAIGRCGPGTVGNNGHIQLFVGWLNTDPADSRYWCLEQTGGSSGPHKTLHDWPAGYRAYRYRDIAEGDDMLLTDPVPATGQNVGIVLSDVWNMIMRGHSGLVPTDVHYIGQRLNALVAAAAADETRDAATLAAINALADVINSGGGNVDLVAVKAAIDAAAGEVKTLVEQRHAEEMDALNQAHAAELAGLRAELDALTAAAEPA